MGWSTDRFPGLKCSAIQALLVLTVAWMGMTPAQAQQMYQCGRTYSQTPCGDDAAVKALPSSQDPEAAPKDAGFGLCSAMARKDHGGPEPESARIQQIGERKSEVIQYAGKSLVAHRFDVGVDAKTPYGVYSGVTPYACWLSEDQRRVLRFAASEN